MTDLRFRADSGVDHWVHENVLLPDFGWALNVGANDGLLNDGTVWLEDMGWNVLCVEPIPGVAAQCRENRRWVCECACSDTDGEADFEVCGAPPHQIWSAIKHRTSIDPGIAAVIRVRTATIDTLLREHSFPRLDYLSVDVEGWEPEVMRGFDVERWKPLVMVIESWAEYFPDIPGYSRHRQNHDNIFVRLP